MPHSPLDLLSQAGPRLYGLLTRLTLRPDVAEELMQELFLKLSRSAAFGRARDPVAYAFRAAIHLALDARRRRPETFALPASLCASVAPPLESLLHAEEAQLALAALAELSPQAREAATLHFIEQHDYAEVARLMDKSPHQVRGLCQDALRQLRLKLHVPNAPETSHE